jgi:hypothetical protein
MNSSNKKEWHNIHIKYPNMMEMEKYVITGNKRKKSQCSSGGRCGKFLIYWDL